MRRQVSDSALHPHAGNAANQSARGAISVPALGLEAKRVLAVHGTYGIPVETDMVRNGMDVASRSLDPMAKIEPGSAGCTIQHLDTSDDQADNKGLRQANSDAVVDGDRLALTRKALGSSRSPWSSASRQPASPRPRRAGPGPLQIPPSWPSRRQRLHAPSGPRPRRRSLESHLRECRAPEKRSPRG